MALTCDDCGRCDDTVSDTLCPHAYDIEGEAVDCKLCPACYDSRSRDI